MVYRVVPVSTLTGIPIVNSVSCSAARGKTSITSPGEGEFSIPLRDHRRPLGHLAHRLSKGWGTTYVIEWVAGGGAFQRWGEVVYAGLVTGHSWSSETGVLRVRTRELASILALRLLYGIGGYPHGTRVIRGATLGDVIRESYRYALVMGSYRWALPVDLPGYSTGPVERTYWRYGFQPASTWLEQLSAEDGAPDHFLRPAWVGGRLRWRLEIGSPRLTGRVTRLPVAAGSSRPKSAVTGLTVETEYQYQRTGVFTIGQGSEEDMRHGEAGEVVYDPDLPYLDATQSFKQVDDLAQLDSLSAATLALSTGGTEQWSFGVQCEGRVAPTDVVPGGTLLLDHPGDEMVGARRHRHMVLEATYTLGTSKVSVEGQAY